MWNIVIIGGGTFQMNAAALAERFTKAADCEAQ